MFRAFPPGLWLTGLVQFHPKFKPTSRRVSHASTTRSTDPNGYSRSEFSTKTIYFWAVAWLSQGALARLYFPVPDRRGDYWPRPVHKILGPGKPFLARGLVAGGIGLVSALCAHPVFVQLGRRLPYFSGREPDLFYPGNDCGLFHHILFPAGGPAGSVPAVGVTHGVGRCGRQPDRPDRLRARHRFHIRGLLCDFQRGRCEHHCGNGSAGSRHLAEGTGG